MSSVSRAYRGDVEVIVSKALEKEKTRRYASAAALADDLRRYLTDQPITARPASTATSCASSRAGTRRWWGRWRRCSRCWPSGLW